MASLKRARGWLLRLVLKRTIVIMLGIGGRFSSFAFVGWNALIAFGDYQVPYEPMWILHMLVMARLVVAGTRANRALGVDMLLQPWLAARKWKIFRWIAKWL